LIGKKHFAIDGCTHKALRKKSDKLKEAAKKIIDKHLSSDSDKDSGVIFLMIISRLSIHLVEGIKKNFGDNVFKPLLVLTADAGFSSEATAQWLMCCMVHNIEKLLKNSEVENWA
jgi:hypothetical protein